MNERYESSREEKSGHLIKAIIGTIVFLFLFVGLIAIGRYLVIETIPEFESVFQNTLLYAAAIGIPLSIVFGLTQYFNKGSTKRLGFGLLTVLLSIIYFVLVLTSINLGYEGEEFIYNLTMPGLIILIVVGSILKGVFYGLEYHTYRDKKEEKMEEDVQYY